MPAAWRHPAAPPEIKKRILRTVLKEIVVTIADGKVWLVAHWQGGDHTLLEVSKQRSANTAGRPTSRRSALSAKPPGSYPFDHCSVSQPRRPTKRERARVDGGARMRVSKPAEFRATGTASGMNVVRSS